MKPAGPRELPAIFIDESVRAILAGAKTQTRRVMNPQPHPKTTLIELNVVEQAWIPWDWAFGTGRRMTGDPIRPRFRVGDVLWVKETWRTEELDEMEEDTELPPGTDGIRFRADGTFRPIENTEAASDAWIKAHRRGAAWRSPIYMPRWASRISLEVTEVRAQRVQEISEEDALAEGVDPYICGEGPVSRESFSCEGGFHNYDHGRAFRNGFEFTWDRINGRKSSWASNPWVFAYTFRRTKP